MADEDAQLREAQADLEKQWKKTYEAALGHAQALRNCGLEGGTTDAASLPRLNASAQDCLASLRTLQRRFNLVAQQLLGEDKNACLKIFEDWKTEYQILHASVREANLQAKSNIQKAAKMERDLLLGGGTESTNLRRKLQTQTGMSAAAESITESLRRTRQLMVQELERGHRTLTTMDESNTTLRKADSEYKGQRYVLNTTRGLLSILKRHDIMDRIILVVGFLLFTAVVMYIFNQRVGLFKMQRNTHTYYADHDPQARTPSLSIDAPPFISIESPPSKHKMVEVPKDPPTLKPKEDSALQCGELEACVTQDYVQNVDTSNVVPVDHNEL